ncbi:endonuclease/exonuclease/phosphatase family protein [Gemmatimonas phototrophica]|nr:endonuclease/exonuclease/phosphatase family protein [Gemmatimonas phototrophica]
MGRQRRSRGEPSAKSARSGSSGSGAWRRVVGRAGQSVLLLLDGIGRELRSPMALRRYTCIALLGYAVALVATWLLLILSSEDWLPATLLAYGPRFVVLLPALLLLPLGLVFARRSAVVATVAVLWAVHSVMGFRFGWPSATTAAPAEAGVIRMVTLNAQGGAMVTPRIGQLLALSPSVINVQECSETLAAALEARGGYHVVRHRNLCTASQWPIVYSDSMPRAAFERVAQYGYGGTGLVVRHAIAHPTTPFQVVNLHLETPRKGLQRLVGNDGLIPDNGDMSNAMPSQQALDGVDLNAEIRLRESERASVWAARTSDRGPLIVTGDFNQPVESTIYRRYWGAYNNAFESRGFGFGYTKFEGRLLRVRIDHILTLPGTFAVDRVWVAPDVGSDHRPVVADLRFSR